MLDLVNTQQVVSALERCLQFVQYECSGCPHLEVLLCILYVRTYIGCLQKTHFNRSILEHFLCVIHIIRYRFT